MASEEFDVGRMRQRVTWQVQSQALDRMHEPIDAWNSMGTYWAEVITDGGSESPNAGQKKATGSGKIRMRNVGAIKATHRFLLQPDSRILDIASVTREGERNAYLLIEFIELKVPQ